MKIWPWSTIEKLRAEKEAARHEVCIRSGQMTAVALAAAGIIKECPLPYSWCVTFDQVRDLRYQLELARMQLAAIDTATKGQFKGCRPEWRSPALEAVLALQRTPK